MAQNKRAPSLDDPGFTPGVPHFDALFAELARASREDAPRIERILARAAERALPAVFARLPHADATERARLVSVLGRLADPRASSVLRRALTDADERVARRAANALGKLEFDAENDAALRSAFGSAGPPLRRSLAEALGKVGGPEARALLEGAHDPDPELKRITRQALLLLERRQSREDVSRIRTAQPLGVVLPILARCRAGLAELLASELAEVGDARVVSSTSVELSFAGSLEALFVARTALGWGVRVELPAATVETLPEAVALALSGATAKAAFQAWTDGGVRYRLSFSEGGHQRALVFRIVEAIRARIPALINDPRAPSWEISVVRDAATPHLVLEPTAFEDPRFAYRRREVRAASHPTIAAALARAAGARPDDVVWDPFVGSGLELVERARIGPYRALIGSDLDAQALEAARENLTAAGLSAELVLGKATELRPAGVTLIVSNPPMGRRLVRDRSLGDLLETFVRHASRVLVSGGRLVWLSPLPERTRNAAMSFGLRTERGPIVDLGGFDAELQTLRRP
jgi:23S rRNA G2445 N2-methylase RlmL